MIHTLQSRLLMLPVRVSVVCSGHVDRPETVVCRALRPALCQESEKTQEPALGPSKISPLCKGIHRGCLNRWLKL